MSLRDTIYDLNVHEEFKVDVNTTVLKVATGWVYRCYSIMPDIVLSVFVPYSVTPDEFLCELHTETRIDDFTNTLKVPNGWIYQTYKDGEIASMVFVPQTLLCISALVSS